MDPSLHLTPTSPAAMPYAAQARQLPDTMVAPVRSAQAPATLPPERPFVAQAVAARLQDGGFAEDPAEILPDDRVLRPYGMPMLPADKPEDDSTALPLPETKPQEL
ncbi:MULTISPECIES: hypothetical protein [unclassified Yoonia]|uniref:hypothetical protein n=1 Tax=unclassified Yoonia TaxID=2629118 RepID=UPI002AFE1EB1|nr:MULTISPECIES: hypothetical protein [unclassified Yoonia]